MYKYALHCIDSHLRCAGQVQTPPGEPHDVSADRSRYSAASKQGVGRLKALSDRPDEPSGQHRHLLGAAAYRQEMRTRLQTWREVTQTKAVR